MPERLANVSRKTRRGRPASIPLNQGRVAMRNETIRSISLPSKRPSLWLLAAAICLSPAAAQAQSNTATGTGALANVTSGADNTADGYFALNQTTTGIGNTATGSQALSSNTTGNGNTAHGYSALFNNTADGNTAIGAVTLGFNTTGANNTATGASALVFNTTGGNNTASGATALSSNTTGANNTASGYQALFSNTIGKSNTASGVNALYANTTGIGNTANGLAALSSNITGVYNTASGFNALSANSKGRYNVGVGANALAAINGHNNIALGANAGKNTTGGNSNIYIGHTGINGIESRVMRIGKAQTRTFIAGIANNATSGASVVIRSNGQLGVVASSARYKQDIKPIGGTADSMAERLKRLRPVTFRYTAEPNAMHYGLIAEEVDRVMPELVVRDDENRPESVQYTELIPLLLQQWKAQRELNALQDVEIARQRTLIEQQKAALTELRRMLATRFARLDGKDTASRSAP